MLERIDSDIASRLRLISLWIDMHRQSILKVINVFLVFLAIVAVSSLIARLGFFLSPAEEQWAQAWSK